jgi:hydrogenase nickel incorporation protein HypB
MCDSCGCGDTNVVPLDLQQRILSENERGAAHNRHHFVERSLVAINVMGSPGAGKTALLEATARALGGQRRIGALAGDLATDNDARRLEAAGIRAHAINTGSACHLDAAMVHRALHHMPWQDLDYLFIENVGNLVCPAVYDLGQAANVVILSVTEGEDKPLKYPVMFHKADLVLISKVDLLPHLPNIRLERIVDSLSRVMPDPHCIAVSATTGDGIDKWVDWLACHEAQRLRPAGSGDASDHRHHDHHHHEGHAHHE